MPFQNNLDLGGGYNDQAFRYTLNFQPVIPIPLGKDWTLISHTILPFIQQSGVLPRVEVGKDAQVRFEPNEPDRPRGHRAEFLFLPGRTAAWWHHCRRGPCIPSVHGNARCARRGKIRLGPTVVLLKPQHGWTHGILANQIWSVAEDENRDDVSTLFLQPFLSYTFPTSTSITLNTETTYDWSTDNGSYRSICSFRKW